MPSLHSQSVVGLSFLVLFLATTTTSVASTESPSVSSQSNSTDERNANSGSDESGDSPSQSPTYSDYSSYMCEDSWLLGTVESGRCYSYDSNYCAFYYMGCTEVSSSMDYYNINDFNDPWTNRTKYGSADISATYCDDVSLNSCKVTINTDSEESAECSCSLIVDSDSSGSGSGSSSSDDDDSKFQLNLTECSVASNMVQPRVPQIVAVEGGIVNIENVDELDGQPMCSHRSVVLQQGGTSTATTRSIHIGGGTPTKTAKARTFTIPGKLDIMVHEDADAFDIDIEPGTQQLFLTKSIQFLMKALGDDPAFARGVTNVKFENIEVSAVSQEELEAEFHIKVSLIGNAEGTLRKLIGTMTSTNWSDYIQFFRDTSANSQAVANVLKRMGRVVFTAYGRADLNLDEDEGMA